MSQALLQRFVDDLAQALPIDAKRSDNVRAILKNAASGLIQKQVPFLASFELRKSTREGKWLAVFHRRCTPQASNHPVEDIQRLPEPIDQLVRRLSEVSDNLKTGVGGASAQNNSGKKVLTWPLASSKRLPAFVESNGPEQC
jgi:hypothetical protein